MEYLNRKNLRDAIRAGGGWLAGCLASRLAQFLIALAMVVIFVWQVGFSGPS